MRASASPLRGASPMRGGGLQEYSSTSTLLQEISTLRSRLKDLEDDTKSSVIGSPPTEGDTALVTMLKKDVAQLEEEKAMQEKEFLNQMTSLQVEHQKQIDSMHQKLSEVEGKLDDANKENQKLSDQLQAPTDPESFARKLEDVREMHAKEMEQMKSNLISADKEIGDSRAEIDALQEELFEMQNHRHELLDEVTTIRMDLTEEQKQSKALVAKMEQMKVESKNLQHESKERQVLIENKSREVAQLQQMVEKRKDLEKTVALQKDEISGLQQTVKALESQKSQAAAEVDENPISSTEKAQLLRDMQEIEERLARFHTKLAEKDSRIDTLTDLLAKEKSTTKDLKDRAKQQATRSTVQQPAESSLNKNAGSKGSPRKPVAGLVASFERRLGGGPVEVGGPTGARCVSDDDDDDDIRGKLQMERDTVAGLREQLRSEREQIAQLNEQLGSNPDRAELNRLRSESVYQNVLREDLERKLQQDNAELKQLRSSLGMSSAHQRGFQEEKKDGEEDFSGLRVMLTKKEQEVESLRRLRSSYEAEAEEKLQRLRNQVDSLQTELESALCKIEDLEHQLEERSGEKTALESMELDLTMAKARQAEIASEKETERKSFEAMISSLQQENIIYKQELAIVKEKLFTSQSDYAEKMNDLEEQTAQLQQKLSSGSQESASRSITTQKLNEADKEVNRLTVELTKLKLSTEDMERSYSEKIKALEREMALIEAEADQELDAKQQVIEDMTRKLVQKEETMDRMEEEKGQMRSSVANLSTSRKDQLEELQAELLDMTAKNKDQSREILMLKTKIDEVDSQKGDRYMKLQSHIEDLEDEIERLHSEGRKKHDKESMGKLKAENIQLRETLREMKLERRQLKDRLDTGTEKSVSRSSQVLRERNVRLKQEVEKLTRRLKKLEDSITRVAV